MVYAPFDCFSKVIGNPTVNVVVRVPQKPPALRNISLPTLYKNILSAFPVVPDMSLDSDCPFPVKKLCSTLIWADTLPVYIIENSDVMNSVQ